MQGPGGREIFYMTPDASIVRCGYAKPGPERYREPPFAPVSGLSRHQAVWCAKQRRVVGYAFDTRDGKRFLVTCA